MNARRHRIAMILNLFIPGAGLIILRREWLGIALSFLFCLFAQVIIFGALLTPADVPGWLMVAGIMSALAIWAVAQWLAIQRFRFITSPMLDSELRDLCKRAEEQLEKQDWQQALRTLEIALSLNDEDPEPILLRAKLATAVGDQHEARRWSKRARSVQ